MNNITIKQRRRRAGIIDFIVLFLIMFICCLPSNPLRILVIETPTFKIPVPNAIACIYVLFKDVLFRDASIGKKIMNIKVVNEIDGCRPPIWKLVARNITLVYVNILEYIVYEVKGNRIGDMAFKTVVVLDVTKL